MSGCIDRRPTTDSLELRTESGTTATSVRGCSGRLLSSLEKLVSVMTRAFLNGMN